MQFDQYGDATRKALNVRAGFFQASSNFGYGFSDITTFMTIPGVILCTSTQNDWSSVCSESQVLNLVSP